MMRASCRPPHEAVRERACARRSTPAPRRFVRLREAVEHLFARIERHDGPRRLRGADERFVLAAARDLGRTARRVALATGLGRVAGEHAAGSPRPPEDPDRADPTRMVGRPAAGPRRPGSTSNSLDPLSLREGVPMSSSGRGGSRRVATGRRSAAGGAR